MLLLDEPTTGVDPVTRQDFWQLLIKLLMEQNDGGFAVIISTPYMDEAARCSRIGFLNHGQLIAEGTPGQLRSILDGRILELRGGPLPLLKQITARQDCVEDVRAFGDRLHLRIQAGQSDRVIEALKVSIPAGGGSFVDARPIPSTLEDVFMVLSGQDV